MSKRVTIIFTSLVLIAGLAIYFFTVSKSHKNGSAVTDVENAMQSWQTYTNEKHGYSVQYPLSWYFKPISTDADFIQQGPNKYNIFAGQWYVAPEDPGKYDITTMPENPFEVDFTIYQIEPKTTFETFFSNLKLDLSRSKQEAAEINGKPAFKLSVNSLDTNTGKTGEYNQVFIKQDDKVFEFSYHGYPVSDTNRVIAERIIQSFKVK